MNPQSVTFDDDEIHRINRWRMVKYWGLGDPRIWDDLSYADQCDALEIAKAEMEIAQYDRMKANIRR
jgi:hypothetical protein